MTVDKADVTTATPGGAAATPAVPRSRWGFFSVGNISLVYIWIALVILFSLLTPDTFLSMNTFRAVMAGQAITAIMAMALLMPVAAKQFDLAIAGNMGLCIVLVATFMAKAQLNMWLAMGLTLLIALVVGAFNALVVVKFKVNSFIATLGSTSILVAMIQWITDGKQIVEGIPEEFTALGRTTIYSFPITIVYMIVIAVILWYVMEYRQIGRYFYAVGSNADAARLAGVRVNRLTAIAFFISAFISGIAGLVFVMRVGSAGIDAGAPYMLPAFAAVFLGATQFKAGRVNVWGTLVAVFVLATGVKGVQLLGAPFWVDDLFNGAALIVAVALAVRSGRQRTSM